MMGRIIKAADLKVRPRRIGEEPNKEIEEILRDGPLAGEILSRSRRKVIDLAVAMATRIVAEKIATDPVVLNGIYERAMEQIGDLNPAVIRVHPEDRAVSRIDDLATARGFSVVEDQSVGSGGCVVEACGVTVDHRIDALLQTMKRAMDRGER